jgi:NADH dehydrogenase/NADH:ubiquinone oxidoreductase subunit G
MPERRPRRRQSREPATVKAATQPEQNAQPPSPDAPKPPANDVTLTIDGRSVTVPKGTLIVEAAKQVGIEVPVFCYHHKLEPVGACRMCLVEIAPGPPRAQAGCITPVADGMAVKVTSPMAVKARADILEFELANHPLDCPVCDKGGECPLQDYTYRHGYPVSRIMDARLHFPKPLPISPDIALDRERCVLCYRCTRYYDEVVWEQELTVGERGADSFITTQFDLCPVGALTSRVWRFQSRPWDMRHTPSICSKCGVGCNVNLWERRGELMRVTARENDAIDDGWICDIGRFQYTEVNDPDRLLAPRIRGVTTGWNATLDALADGLRGRGERLGIAIPGDITNEEAYLLSKLLAGPLTGARVVMAGRSSLPPPDPDRQLMISELDQCKAIVIVGSDVRRDAPIVNLRVKKAVAKRAARLITVNPDEVDFDRHAGVEHLDYSPEAVRRLQRHPALGAGPIGILYGDRAGDVSGVVAQLAEAVGAKVMPLYRAANERGALDLGILATPAASLDGCQAVLLWGPPADRPPRTAKFVAAWDIRLRPEHGQPDVVVPETTFAEDQGSYVNLAGQAQFLVPALDVEPPRRHGWEVLVELGLRLGMDWSYLGIYEIQREVARAHPELQPLAEPPPASPRPGPVAMGAARP